MTFLKSLKRRFKSLKQSHPAKRPVKKSRRLEIEALESREVPVVGGALFPPAVVAGTGFDGVVRLDRILNAAGTMTQGLCTGSLLSSGRHILTAAHCLTNANGVIDTPNGIRVTFELPRGNRTIDVPVANYSIHAGWQGNNVSFASDIAILKLPRLAPTGAERFDIYRGSDELSPDITDFTFYGYGATNTTNPDGSARSGAFGHDGGFGLKQVGQNHFEAEGQIVAGPVGTLAFDFDSGVVQNDALGQLFGINNTGLGISEAYFAPGDSGGPSFLGRLVAGVSSFTRGFNGLPDTLNGVNSSFGEIGFVTRVSAFKDWIDAQTASPYALTLDASLEVDGNNGTADDIIARRNGANIELLINGRVVHSDLASQITGITIIGSNDADVITLGAGLAVPVNLHGGNGSDTVVAPSTSNYWDIFGTNQGTLYFGTDFANFEGVENLTGGMGTDTFKIHNGMGVSGEIAGGAGTAKDTLDYSAWSTGVWVDLGGGWSTGASDGVTGIESVIGSNGTGFGNTDTLLGASVPNTWTLTASNAGNVGGVTFSSIENLIGGLNGSDHLVATNGANRWNLTSAKAGDLNGTLNFTDMEHLAGGTGRDEFVFGPNARDFVSIGGGGLGTGVVDVLDYSGYGAAVTVSLTSMTLGVNGTATGMSSFNGVESVVGSNAADTLQGANVANTWNLTASRAGNVNGVFTFSSVESLVGGTGTDTLKGAHVTNTWELRNGSSKLNGSLGFSAMENLVGGSGADRFSFFAGVTVPGTLTGGGGSDTLDYSQFNGRVNVDLTRKRASRVTSGLGDLFENVTGSIYADVITGNALNNILRGGRGVDTLVGVDGNDILLGGGENDTLSGGKGQDILFGGLGADTLRGDAGEDILIGGTTNYDAADDQVLQEIMAGWTESGRDYSTRVERLRNGGGPSRFLLNATTVRDDGAKDTLTGGVENDWFWANMVGGVADTHDRTGLEVLDEIV